MTDPAMPRARSTDKRYFGVFEGLVTDVKDPENEGRVKLTYPWFHEDMESDWAPVLQFFAGPSHGSFFIPEVGSLVLCACRHGDLRLAYVLGCLYNGLDKPFSNHVRRREIASTKGHRVAMYDSDGDSKGAIVIEAAGGSKITVSSTGHVVISATGALTLEAPVIRFRGDGYDRVLTPMNAPL